MGYKIININITILKMVNDIFLKNGKVDIKAHNRLQPNTYSVSVVISKYNMTAMKNYFSVSLFSLRVKLIELLLVIMKRIFVIGSGENILAAEKGYRSGCGYGGGFALLVVLFILLIIVGAACFC
ncbi:hypothetical protein IK9_02453 [Bacillus cereus VD166]|nr:hypothetical protein IK9_02453 [Bacillus cereus VD166]